MPAQKRFTYSFIFLVGSLYLALCHPARADIAGHAADCKPAKLELAIKQGGDVAKRDESGNTPLHWAARNGGHACVEVLLKYDPPLDVQDSDGSTALALAATSNYLPEEVLKTVDLLLAAGADVGLENRFGYSPLHAVLAYGSGGFQLGGDPNVLKPLGKDRIPAYKGGSYEVVKKLLAAGAKVNRIDNKGYSDIEMAVRNRMPATIELMVKSGGNLNILSKDSNRSMLHVAAFTNRYFTIPYLIAKGLDINGTDAAGGSPLMLAVASKHTKSVKVLLQEGANTEVKDISGFTPLLNAVSNGNLEMTKLLLDGGANPDAATAKSSNTALHFAAFQGNVEAIRLLLSHKADKSIKDKHGNTALGFATEKGHSAVVNLLK